jgi:lipoprotein NlpD
MRSDLPPSPLVRLRVPIAAAVALLVAACASSTPAPVVPRTQPGAQRPAAPATSPAATAPQPPAAPAAPAAPTPEASVQTAPIRSGAIESRGLESRPLDPRGAPPATAPGATPPASPAATAPASAAPTLPPNAKTGPRGAKVPWSDSALADLRAAESAPSSAVPSASARPPEAKPADPKAAEAPEAKPAEGVEGEWAWPATGKVIQTFAESGNKGVVLGGKVGDPVLAAADGRVIFSGNGPRGYGNLVIVKHTNDLLSVYAHNRTLAVKEGQPVKRGQKIAELGDSGTTSPRLHFEIRQQGKPVDPSRFLPKR